MEELWRREGLRDVARPPLTLLRVVERMAARYRLEVERVRRRGRDPRVAWEDPEVVQAVLAGEPQEGHRSLTQRGTSVPQGQRLSRVKES